MSLTLEIIGGTHGSWPLSTSALGHLDRLRETNDRWAVDEIFGDESLNEGKARIVPKEDLVKALDELLPLAKTLPAGFQVRVPPLFGGKHELVGRGVGGFLIDGKYHVVNCWDDYWTLQETERLRAGEEPARRYEPTTIQTQNIGTVTVERKESKRSDLVTLLQSIRKFLNVDTAEQLTVLWG